MIWRQCWTCRWCRPGWLGVGHCCTLSRRRGSLQTDQDQDLFPVPVLCRHLQIRRGPDQSWRWCSRSPGLANDDASFVFWQEASSPLLIEHSCPELGLIPHSHYIYFWKVICIKWNSKFNVNLHYHVSDYQELFYNAKFQIALTAKQKDRSS